MSIDQEFLSTVDRKAFSAGFLQDESDEKDYWLNRSPLERLKAVELMRRYIYGYVDSPARFQRVLEITELPSG